MMGKAAYVAAAAAALLVATSAVWAQSPARSAGGAAAAAGGGERTIEQLYLQNVAFRIVHEQATDLSRDSKLLALASIREMIDNGSVSKDEAVALDTLEYLANEGTGRVARSDNRQINDFPEVRREACNLLGRIGGESAARILMQEMLYEDEPMVLAEAVYALGQIGVNPGGAASERIGDVVIHRTDTNPDNNFAFAALLAFEKLAKKNNGINDPTAFRAVVAISQGGYISAVKEKAMQVLEELKQYG